MPIPASWLVKPGKLPPEDIAYPVVAKSQVPVGGRAKAGGVQTVETVAVLSPTLGALFSLEIKGYLPTAVLLEEKLIVDREFYLALRLNRDRRELEWLFSQHGGIDIEDNATHVYTEAFSSSDSLERIAKVLMVDHEKLEPVLNALASCLTDNDLLLCEVNPLVLTENGQLIAADAKCLVDDNAQFRHPELPWPSVTGNHPKPLGGTIGCVANGAGMAMSTMDTIVAMGGKPANFLDIGGGTGEKEFVAALEQIKNLPGVTSIIINIFAGISRCDEIARGIIAAREQIAGLPALFIRLEGTNREIAVKLLDEAQIAIEADLASCVRKAMAVTR